MEIWRMEDEEWRSRRLAALPVLRYTISNPSAKLVLSKVERSKGSGHRMIKRGRSPW
jgi:hypothetical protein